MLNHENFEELLANINENLSKLESQVFQYMQDGYNYKQIAIMMQKNPKQIDNAMQRIKAKIKDILKKNKND